LTLGGMKHCPREVLVLANVRARMCEIIGSSVGNSDAGVYYTVGLLSVLDVLAGRPLEEIIAELPLRQDVKASLINREGRLGAALDVVLGYEAGAESIRRAVELPVDETQLGQAYLEAVASTDALFGDLAIGG
jgi:EAL and modified HD-GYP domain-containing signal transduction protein